MGLVLDVAACSSAPVRYYTLLEPAPIAARGSSPAPFLIDVSPVDLPAQLDQPQLVVRRGESGIAMSDNERWAAPLGDELRTALSEKLTQRLDTQDVAGLQAPMHAPIVRIELSVNRLDAVLGSRVQFDATWSLGYANFGARAPVVCRGRFDEAAPGGYPALVRAMQSALASLADRIALDATGWARDQEWNCVAAAGSHHPPMPISRLRHDASGDATFDQSHGADIRLSRTRFGHSPDVIRDGIDEIHDDAG